MLTEINRAVADNS
jgi:hypothetical protein